MTIFRTLVDHWLIKCFTYFPLLKKRRGENNLREMHRNMLDIWQNCSEEYKPDQGWLLWLIQQIFPSWWKSGISHLFRCEMPPLQRHHNTLISNITVATFPLSYTGICRGAVTVQCFAIMPWHHRASLCCVKKSLRRYEKCGATP